MRLITWNCQGAFRKKAQFIVPLQPDLLLVQECEHPDKLEFNPAITKPTDMYWYSDGGNRGLGLFSFSGYTFELLSCFNPEFRYVLPFRVTGNGQSFTLFAIWAMDNKERHEARYIGQVWFALNHYKDLLEKSTILIGDFNSNKIWDYKDRIACHTDVVNKLAENNIHSVYHKHFDQEQGKEQHPTFFLQRNENKPYHIDYCFASSELLQQVTKVEIGAYSQWITQSDHVPLIVDFSFESAGKVPTNT